MRILRIAPVGARSEVARIVPQGFIQHLVKRQRVRAGGGREDGGGEGGGKGCLNHAVFSSRPFLPANKRIIAGITYSVSAMPSSSPPTTAIPSGRRLSAPVPWARAMGS